MISVYKVEFKKYTNGLRNTVWSEKLNEFLKTEMGYVIIKESDIEYIMNFGDGISSMEYIGKLFDRENKDAKNSVLNLTLNVNVKDSEDIEKVYSKIERYLKTKTCLK